ncbi:MAG: hypothetical protein MI741_23480, partial [Rhodospirillales bacterium]|nr:hypothetical protein [Rhodospirillales bacterium]
MRLAIPLFLAALLTTTLQAQPNLPEGIALYAGGNLTFDSFSSVWGGGVVAGGDVAHNGGILNVEWLSAGRGFTAASAAFQNSRGPLLFNDNIINLGGLGSVFAGSVTSTRGNIDFL